MLYMCISGKIHYFYLVLLQGSPFFYCLDQIWVHLLVSQMPMLGLATVFEGCRKWLKWGWLLRWQLSWYIRLLVKCWARWGDISLSQIDLYSATTLSSILWISQLSKSWVFLEEWVEFSTSWILNFLQNVYQCMRTHPTQSIHVHAWCTSCHLPHLYHHVLLR
jgi:hypothetical protein